jgi:hypothetical protein
VGAAALLCLLALPGSSWAGAPGTWTKLATVGNGADTVGMARTADGSLHLAWWKPGTATNTNSYGTSTISLAGKLLATGTAVSNWHSLEPDPQLVRDGSGLRLIFEGGRDTSGTDCYNTASVFTATSSNGSSWSLSNQAIDHGTYDTGNLAATTESDGMTPVTTFGAGRFYHVGVGPGCPATSPDHTIPIPSNRTPSNPAIVTASDGSIWVATFQAFSNMGYYIARILPTEGPQTKAPDSQTSPAKNNQPLEPVALAARVGGGVYMAYCVSNTSQPCVHIDLWKAGSPKPMVVPGSENTGDARVALAATPQGRLAVAWFNAPNGDNTKAVIHAVRTNMTGTAFGAVQKIKPPPHTVALTDIQVQASSGRLDVVVNVERQTGTTYPQELWHTQILPGLTLAAAPTTFSHKSATTVTFTVTDAGEGLAGANVSCLSKTGVTGSTGQVKLHFPKGTPSGRHVCSAGASGYHGGKVTIKVT